MSNKIYFEMGENERQLHLISNNLDYAVCVLGEGLPDEFHGVDRELVPEILSNITDHLIAAWEGVGFLLAASDNERAEPVRMPRKLAEELRELAEEAESPFDGE